MNEITISVKEFYERAKQMMDDGMDIVTLNILGGEDDEIDGLPLFLSLEASSKAVPYEGISYDEIEAISE